MKLFLVFSLLLVAGCPDPNSRITVKRVEVVDVQITPTQTFNNGWGPTTIKGKAVIVLATGEIWTEGVTETVPLVGQLAVVEYIEDGRGSRIKGVEWFDPEAPGD